MNLLKKLFSSASAKLLDAAKNGPLEEVKRLLASGADKEATDEGGLTALHLAAVNGHADVVECLLAAGADKDAKGKDGWTAFYMAVFSGHADVVECLLAAGADKDAKGKGGWTALHLAATKGHADVVQCLLAAGADKEASNSDGWTALHWAAYEGHAAVVQCLLAAGADKEASNSDGLTALHFAAGKGDVAVVQYLLAAGADREAKSTRGSTALGLAACEGHAAVVECLSAASAANPASCKAAAASEQFPSSTLNRGVTIVQATVDIGIGNKLYLRGDGPGLTWDRGVPMEFTGSDNWTWSTQTAVRPFAYKPLVNDTTWSIGENFTAELGVENAITPRFPQASRAQSTREDSPLGGLKILKKKDGGGLRESTGSLEDVAPLFQMAHGKYQSVMAAARSNSLTASHERELLEAVELLTKVIELHGTRGEPYGLRGGLYMVYGQINRDRDYLDKAERDYSKALDVGGSDPSNHATWRNSISQIGMIRGMI